MKARETRRWGDTRAVASSPRALNRCGASHKSGSQTCDAYESHSVPSPMDRLPALTATRVH